MKLYKFRSLGDEDSLCRAERILRTGEFWCSRFWELNDPMEGVYTTREHEKFAERARQKGLYVICSFSGVEALSDPTMWGYYANGFRGVAIEIEVDDYAVRPVTYKPQVLDTDLKVFDVEALLTTKLVNWSHEYEHRYLEHGEVGTHRIGRITGVYIGMPYANTTNKREVFRENTIRAYRDRVSCLKRVVRQCPDAKFCRYVRVGWDERYKRHEMSWDE